MASKRDELYVKNLIITRKIEQKECTFCPNLHRKSELFDEVPIIHQILDLDLSKKRSHTPTLSRCTEANFKQPFLNSINDPSRTKKRPKTPIKDDKSVVESSGVIEY
jgi:hypothetical protein